MSRWGEAEPAELRSMSTAELLHQAVREARQAALAELLHAKEELKEEAKKGQMAAVLFGLAATFGLTALVLGFAVIGLALPVGNVGGMGIVAGATAFIALWCALIGYMSAPKHPMLSTRKRIKELFERAEDELREPH